MHEKRRKDARLNGQLDRPWLGHQPNLYWLLIFYWILNIWKDFKVLSCFIQKCLQPPACSGHGLYRILSSDWLAHFYVMKKSAKCRSILVLIAGRSSHIPLTSHSPKNNCWLSRILEPGSAKKIAVYALTTVCRRNRRNGFLYEAAQNFEVFSNIQD
jgi:hypothetical protein